MDISSANLQKELREGLSSLETLRDEIRVRVHLATLEAKDRWSALETQLLSVEDAAKNAKEDSRQRLNEALDKLKAFRASLK